MKVLFALLWASVGLQLAFSLVGLALKAPSSPSEAFDATVAAITGSVFGLVGGVLLWRRPDNRIGWLFALAGLGWSTSNFAAAYGTHAVSVTPQWPGASVALWLDGGNGWPVWLSTGLLLLLVVTFPDGRLPSSRWRLFAWLTVANTVAAAVATAFAAEPRQLSGAPAGINPFAAPAPIGEALRLFQFPLSIVLLPLYVVAAAAMVHRFRRARGLERQQLKWFAASIALVAALLAAVLPFIVAFGGPEHLPPLGQAALRYLVFPSVNLIPVAAAIAILRYRLYDIDLLIKRTIVYGATTAAIAATFFLGIVALQAALRSITSGSQLAIAASTLISFGLFQPIRRRLQQTVDRRFDRSRYDAARTLDAFTEDLRDEVDLDDLKADLIAAVRRTMSPAHASLWLRERGR